MPCTAWVLVRSSGFSGCFSLNMQGICQFLVVTNVWALCTKPQEPQGPRRVTARGSGGDPSVRTTVTVVAGMIAGTHVP